jgi:hypothetical protein
VCVCVCVREREKRERSACVREERGERERKTQEERGMCGGGGVCVRVWWWCVVVVVVCVCACGGGGGGGGAESMRGACFPPSGASSTAGTPTKGNTLVSFTFLDASRVQRNTSEMIVTSTAASTVCVCALAKETDCEKSSLVLRNVGVTQNVAGVCCV